MAARDRSRSLGIYILLVTLGGAVGLACSRSVWGQGYIGAWELLGFLLLAAALDLMVVPLTSGGGAAASFAVLFAGFLVFGSAPAAWVAAVAALFSEGLVRRRPLSKVGFNAGHSVLSLLAAGVIYQWLGGKVGESPLAGFGQMLAVGGATATLWVLETLWVSTAVALERGGRARQRLLSSLGPMLVLDGALASVGLLLALLYLQREHMASADLEGTLFVLAIATIPSALIYYAYRLQGSVRLTYTQALESLASLMEAKLGDVQPGHGEKVARLAAAMAQALELPPDQAEQVRYAGYLHDIGKVGVPAALLHRGRDVFSGEPEQVRLHPEIGAQIITPIQFLRPAAEIVRSHHERFDGLGYPAGLGGAQIPLGARVLSIANAYIGMTHSHAQAPLTPEQALSRLRQGAGSRFDPELVDCLAHVLRALGDVSQGDLADLAHLRAWAR